MKVKKLTELEDGQIDVELTDVLESEYYYFVRKGRKIDPTCYNEDRCFALAMQVFMRQEIEKMVV